MSPSAGTPAQALIVDDDPTIRQSFSLILELGCDLQVYTAENGEEAISAIRKDPTRFKVVLLDLMMPGLSGFDVLSLLQANLATRHIPIIVISAIADQYNVLFELPGVKKVLQKGGLEPPQIASAVNEILGSPA